MAVDRPSGSCGPRDDCDFRLRPYSSLVQVFCCIAIDNKRESGLLMLSPDKPTFAEAPLARFRTPGFSRAADRRAVCRLHAAHLDSDLDAPAAAAVRLRQSSGAHAGDRDDQGQSAARQILRNRLAGHSQPDHGFHRAGAGAGDEHLRRRPGLHRRHVRPDHFRDHWRSTARSSAAGRRSRWSPFRCSTITTSSSA